MVTVAHARFVQAALWLRQTGTSVLTVEHWEVAQLPAQRPGVPPTRSMPTSAAGKVAGATQLANRRPGLE